MAEADVGSCPQVFVVDSQSNYVSMPARKKPMWPRVGPKLLLPLLVLTVSGLVAQGFFLYTLHKKVEAFSIHASLPLSLNLSNPKITGQQGGAIMSQVGFKDSNEIRAHPEQIQQRPFAHLMGSSTPVGENNVVQWIHDRGVAITRNMSYDKGRLLVEKDGYYYLYSKVHLNAAAECSLIQHKVMRATSAYGESLELMRSKSFHCPTKRTKTQEKSRDDQDLWNSFLAGIFYLQSGDKIFVTLEDIRKLCSGPADNFMGAFMIFP